MFLLSTTKTIMLTNDIELLLAEHKCTIDDVEEIVKGISDDAKIQKKALYHNFKPSYALMMYTLTDYFRKEIPAANIADIDVLKFVNVK